MEGAVGVVRGTAGVSRALWVGGGSVATDPSTTVGMTMGEQSQVKT
jgi:hypothetical protein